MIKAGVTVIGLVVLAALMAPSGSVAADDCTAKLDSMLFQEDKERDRVTYVFKVDVKADVTRCAEVDYALVVIEEDMTGAKETKEVLRRTRVRDGVTTSAKVNYKMNTKDKKMASWKVELRACTLCGAKN